MSIGLGQVSQPKAVSYIKIKGNKLTSSKFTKAYPTLWNNFMSNIRPTTNERGKNILAIICKIYISQLSFPLFLFMELDIKVLTDPQIHKIVLSMASFIHNGFQHSLQELTYIQLSYFPRYNLLDRSCLVYCVA